MQPPMTTADLALPIRLGRRTLSRDVLSLAGAGVSGPRYWLGGTIGKSLLLARVGVSGISDRLRSTYSQGREPAFLSLSSFPPPPSSFLDADAIIETNKIF